MKSLAIVALAGTLLAVTAHAQDPSLPLGPNADLGGRRLLPNDSPWHKDVSREPLDPNSQRILARIGLNKPLHADFGTVYEGAPIGIPYVVVSKSQPKVPIAFTEAADESDPGPYPIPPDAPIEGGPASDGDRHVLGLDRESWTLYELFTGFPDGKGGWKAGSGAKWDLEQNQVRPEGWTSADAAGLPILPGLVRYDEVVGNDRSTMPCALPRRRPAEPMCRRQVTGPAHRTTTICRRWACACACGPITICPDSPRKPA